MNKKVAVKVTRKRVTSSASTAVRKGQVKTPAAAPRTKRGAPKAFTATQVPLKRLPVRNPSFEKYGETCRKLYVEQDLSAQKISDRLKNVVAANTILRWAKRHGWEAARQAKLETPEAMVADVLLIFREFVTTAKNELKQNKKLPNEKFWDNLIKGSAAVERISGEAHYASHMTKFVEGLLKYCQANRPDLLTQVSDLLSGYSAAVLSSR